MASLTPLTFDQIAGLIANELHPDYNRRVTVLGITGPSCVGKTTLSERIAMAIRGKRGSALVVSADSFLKEEYRGRGTFRQNVSDHLGPAYFDYGQLLTAIGTLMAHKSCRMDIYARGSGWHTKQMVHPASVLLIDGLFLDGFDKREAAIFDLRLILQSTEESIAKWRRLRDHEFRKNRHDGFRGAEETEREIERTLLAYRCYERFGSPKDASLFLDRDHRVTALNGHLVVPFE